MPTTTHLLAGGGGDARGFHEAGYTLLDGANHAPHCVDTLRANWSRAKWYCENVDQMALDKLSRSDVVVGSVICQELSPNGGNKVYNGQQSIFPEENRAAEKRYARTYATAYDMLRVAEYFRPKALVVENVVEFPMRWFLYDWWRQAHHMLKPGYKSYLLFMNAALVNEEHNPGPMSWRNRAITAFVREGLEQPDFTFRPAAYCGACRRETTAQQMWKSGRTMGEYREQYVMVCVRCKEPVEPHVRTAAEAFDLDDIGETFGSKEHTYGKEAPVRLAKAVEYLGTGVAKRLSSPVSKASINGRYHCVMEMRNHGYCASIHEPLTTISAQGNHHALVTAPDGWRPGMRVDIRDLHVRTIAPHEQARAMGFPAHHKMVGRTDKELTSLAGNAVPPPLARWVAERLLPVVS